MRFRETGVSPGEGNLRRSPVATMPAQKCWIGILLIPSIGLPLFSGGNGEGRRFTAGMVDKEQYLPHFFSFCGKWGGGSGSLGTIPCKGRRRGRKSFGATSPASPLTATHSDSCHVVWIFNHYSCTVKQVRGKTTSVSNVYGLSFR